MCASQVEYPPKVSLGRGFRAFELLLNSIIPQRWAVILGPFIAFKRLNRVNRLKIGLKLVYNRLYKLHGLKLPCHVP